MTLSAIVGSAQSRLGLRRISTVVNNTDAQVTELLAFAQQEGFELMKRFPWEELVQEHTFTTTASDVQAGALPADYDRFLDGSMYNRTTDRKVCGPISAQEWQLRKAFIEATTIHDWFRIRGGNLLIAPEPEAGETIAYEYVSRNWVKGADDTRRSSFMCDDDTVCFPNDEMMVQGIRWRWLKAKGLEWGTVYQEYNTLVEKSYGQHAGAPTLRAAGRMGTFYMPNVPETGFGQ